MANLIANLLSTVSPMSQAMQKVGGVAQAMQSGNPMGALVGQNNPQMKQVMDYPKQAFYSLAKQKGIDPETFLNQVRGMMNRR